MKIIDVFVVAFITFLINIVWSVLVSIGYSVMFAVRGGDLYNTKGLIDYMYNDPYMMMFASMYNILAVLVVFIFWRFVDRQEIQRLGFVKTGRMGRQLLWGITAATAAIAAIIVMGLTAGIITFRGMGTAFYTTPQIITALIVGIIAFVLVGFGEEAVYRSYIQNHITDLAGNRLGLVIAAVIFTAAHLLTYAKLLDLIDVFLAGIILGYAFILTKSIYLPAAFHFMWDYLQLSIFRLQDYEYYKGPVLLVFNNIGDLTINSYKLGNKLEVVFIAVELIIILLMFIYRRKIISHCCSERKKEVSTWD